jgi:hypothetical protein
VRGNVHFFVGERFSMLAAESTLKDARRITETTPPSANKRQSDTIQRGRIRTSTLIPELIDATAE